MEEIHFNGAIEKEPTEQDVLLGSFTQSSRPDVYMPDFLGIIEMQGKRPACGAHSGQSLKQVLSNFRGSPRFLWNKIKQIDGYGASAGTDMLSIMKSLKNNGICFFDLIGNDVTLSDSDYANPTISNDINDEAKLHKIDTYAFEWNPTFESLKQAIYDHKAVIMLLRVGAEWWTKDNNLGNSWEEKDILPLRTNVPITSGHFVVAFAYDEKYIYFINEWSDTWGKKGIGYFGKEYMPRCIQIGTAVDLETTKYIFIKTLKFGSKGFDVKQLQKKLNLKDDGIFGKDTKLAVQGFQLTNHLVADGIVGPLTIKELNK